MLLARLAHEALGNDAMAITIESAVVPRTEALMARELATAIGIQHRVLTAAELDLPHFSTNPPDRCYHCRKVRDSLARDWATRHGFNTIADGLNYSDLSDYRPGLRAATEDDIWHPFIEFKFTKDDIRSLAKELGLPGWDRPSMACLASRFPHSFAVTQERVERVDSAEEYLRASGFNKARVRHFPHDLALVEVDDPQRAIAMRHEIAQRLGEYGFAFIALDLEDFASGKMNRTAGEGRDNARLTDEKRLADS